MRIAHPCRSLISPATRHFLFICSTSSPPLLRPRRSRRIAADKSMASGEEAPNLTADDDEKYGFRRPEMYESKLAGTVQAYGRHLFLCYKSPEAWASRVEDSDADPLPKRLASALNARKNDIAVKTKLTICEGRDGTEFSDGDVLVFPEMIKYR